MLISAPAPEVKAALVNGNVSAGSRLVKDSEYELTFERPLTGVAAVMLGSRFNPEPAGRISYTITPAGDQTRVIVDIAAITNPGSGFEQRTPLNNSEASAEAQAALERVKADLESKRKPPAPASVRGKKSA